MEGEGAEWKVRGQMEDLELYFSCQHELWVNQDCVMWGVRVLVPRSPQGSILHAEHLDIVKIKSLAGSYVWWSGINMEIEAVTKSCRGSQKPAFGSTFHPWEYPEELWIRIHVDYAGPLNLTCSWMHFLSGCWKWSMGHMMPPNVVTTINTSHNLVPVFFVTMPNSLLYFLAIIL